MDETFEREQRHLTETYGKLEEIEAETAKRLTEMRRDAAKDMSDMREELSLDFTADDMAMETLAQYQSMNTIIEGYNRSMEVTMDRFKKTRQLLERPYFAKVSLRFKPGAEPRDIYLGTVGMTDESSRHFIVDWRSPVAETYYNQQMGQMSYRVDDRTINVELMLRRQFDVERDKLNAYFDTTVAIEDPLLLAQLAKTHSEKLQAITATIQREQNQVVRHDDVDVLLVNGIAGSGKTSVLLQRIAYLFYTYRETLEPKQVHLFTPNPVFGKYIDNVLPDMGESNPQITTWHDFVDGFGLTGRGMGDDTTAAELEELERAMETLTFEEDDFSDLVYGGKVLFKGPQIRKIAEKFPSAPIGPRKVALINEELYDRLESKCKQLATTNEVYDALDNMPLDEQVDFFGQQIVTNTEEDLKKWATRYVELKYGGATQAIEDCAWLNVAHIGARMAKDHNMSAVKWLYLRLLLTGEGDRDARFVMIDEVQDYTVAQLKVLARYFNHAHFLLLGDEHQAIKEHTATFPEIRDLFAAVRGQVDECRLMTSYRSTPEITDLFCSLLDNRERVAVSSVQHGGAAPRIAALPADAWASELTAEVERAGAEEGLTAVICTNKGAARKIAKMLGGRAELVKNDMQLKASGVVVLDLPLAKGLEFDRVIIPDADPAAYPDTPLARRRLYTAISRATHAITILGNGTLTGLLSQIHPR